MSLHFFQVANMGKFFCLINLMVEAQNTAACNYVALVTGSILWRGLHVHALTACLLNLTWNLAIHHLSCEHPGALAQQENIDLPHDSCTGS